MTKRKEPTQTCTSCLRDWPLDHFCSFQPNRAPVRRCKSCREQEVLRRKILKQGYGPTHATKRKCHDCPAITADYRCSKCLAAWRKNNHVSSDAYYSADNCIGGNIVGSGCRHNTGGKP